MESEKLTYLEKQTTNLMDYFSLNNVTMNEAAQICSHFLVKTTFILKVRGEKGEAIDLIHRIIKLYDWVKNELENEE